MIAFTDWNGTLLFWFQLGKNSHYIHSVIHVMCVNYMKGSSLNYNDNGVRWLVPVLSRSAWRMANATGRPAKKIYSGILIRRGIESFGNDIQSRLPFHSTRPELCSSLVNIMSPSTSSVLAQLWSRHAFPSHSDTMGSLMGKREWNQTPRHDTKWIAHSTHDVIDVWSKCRLKSDSARRSQSSHAATHNWPWSG